MNLMLSTGNDIDKSYPIKKIKENRYKVKFTKHSMTETIYKQDKKFTGRKEAKTIPPIKITVSLTSWHQKLLE